MKISGPNINHRFDYWSNVWNVMLMEYYLYLGCWFNIAFN